MKKYLIALLACVTLLSCSHQEFTLGDRIGICRKADADLAKAAGCAYFELSVSGCLVPDKCDSVWMVNYEKYKDMELPTLAANGFYPGNFRLTGPDVDEAANLAYAETAMQRAKQLGIKILVLGSSKARNIPEGFDRDEAIGQFVSLCKGIAKLGEKYDIVTVLEPLRTQESNFLNTVAEGVEIAEQVKSPYLCVLADFYHMLQVGEDPEDIVKAGKCLKHCHIAENDGRTCPGEHGEDFTAFFRALKKINYQGMISIESGWKDFPTQVGPAIAIMREQISKVANE